MGIYNKEDNIGAWLGHLMNDAETVVYKIPLESLRSLIKTIQEAPVEWQNKVLECGATPLCYLQRSEIWLEFLEKLIANDKENRL